MNEITFKRKDVFSLLIEGNRHFCFFLKFSPKSDIIVFIDSNNKKIVKGISLKTIKDKYSPEIVSIQQTPIQFQEFYNNTLFSIKKNSKVYFYINNEIFYGTVLKGGKKITVEFVLNGAVCSVSGPANKFSLVE